MKIIDTRGDLIFEVLLSRSERIGSDTDCDPIVYYLRVIYNRHTYLLNFITCIWWYYTFYDTITPFHSVLYRLNRLCRTTPSISLSPFSLLVILSYKRNSEFPIHPQRLSCVNPFPYFYSLVHHIHKSLDLHEHQTYRPVLSSSIPVSTPIFDLVVPPTGQTIRMTLSRVACDSSLGLFLSKDWILSTYLGESPPKSVSK